MSDYTVGHLFSGSGGGAIGFQRAGFHGAFAVDYSESACRNFEMFTGETATHGDVADIEPGDLRRLSPRRPDVLFTSPPCKGFSGCLSEAMASDPKYLALNSLAFRGVWLALEAWRGDPPPLIVFENVPRIQSRGKAWLGLVESLLHSYGYAVARSTHDCGVIGGLAQHRTRFLLVARHMPQVEAYLRVPVSKRVRGIGEVLGSLPVPLPGSTDGGRMHRLPRLSAMNWVRLALIPAGGDWRDIPESVALPVRGGRPNGPFGVEDWSAPSHAVLGHTTARDTWGSVADPRLAEGVQRHAGGLGVEPWAGAAHTVTGQHGRRGWDSVADPRVVCARRDGGHGVKGWDSASASIIAHPSIDNFPAQVADPRLGCRPRGGTMGVESWAEPSHTVRGHYDVGNGPAAVADPRMPAIDGEPFDVHDKRPTYMVIRAADGTWHRPLTTLELAALQSFPVRRPDGSWLELDGNSHAGWREQIGNAVPPDAAEAIGLSCRATLDAAACGRWTLDGRAIWVRREHAAIAAGAMQ